MYIRHGPKAYKNGANVEYSLDPGLTEAGKSAAHTKFTELINRYGPPAQIVTSPYFRARETALIAQHVINEMTGVVVPVMAEPLIGEYLGHQSHKNLSTSLRPETLSYRPIPPENWKQYSARVRLHTRKSVGNTWYITHGIVIQSVAHFRGIEIKHPHELEGIMIDSNGVSVV